MGDRAIQEELRKPAHKEEKRRENTYIHTCVLCDMVKKPSMYTLSPIYIRGKRVSRANAIFEEMIASFPKLMKVAKQQHKKSHKFKAENKVNNVEEHYSKTARKGSS